MPESTARPTFNVVEAFSGITISQLNDQFRDLLVSFFGEFDNDDLEPEITSFRHALSDHSQSWTLYDEDKQQLKDISIQRTFQLFNVSAPFAGVTIIQLHEEFRELLVLFFDDIDDLEPEIKAFRYALNDPKRSRALREQRQELKRNGFKTAQRVG